MASHNNMRIGAASPNRREIIYAINALKPRKATGLDDLPAELFGSVPAVSAESLLRLIRKLRESEIFTNEWKELGKATCLECECIWNSLRGMGTSEKNSWYSSNI